MAPPPKRTRGAGAGGPEFISLDGLRTDGRRASEVRKIRAMLGPLSRADGSAYYEQGHTRILAAVYGPHETRRGGGGGGGGAGGGGGGGGGTDGAPSHDRAVIHCELSTASFASAQRRRARKRDRRSVAHAAVLQRVFEGVILVDAYARSTIEICVQVLQNDGGAMTAAAVNAAALALCDAGVAMSDLVVACNVGFVDGVIVTDPAAVEGGGDRPELFIAVLAHAGKVAACTLESRLPDVAVMDEAMQAAMRGARQIFKVLEFETRSHGLGLLDSRGLVTL